MSVSRDIYQSIVLFLIAVVSVSLGTQAAAGQAKAPAPTVTLQTKPSPPAMGKTDLTVTVKAADGKPVTGADVIVEFVMPAMPAMKMAEMRNKVTLKPAADAKLAAAGTYTGTGQIMMSGTWNTTVTVKVNGKDYAELKQTLNAK